MYLQRKGEWEREGVQAAMRSGSTRLSKTGANLALLQHAGLVTSSSFSSQL